MSEALNEIDAADKRKRKQAKRHAAKVSSLKKAKPASAKRKNTSPSEAVYSKWKGMRTGVLLLVLCIVFGVQSAYQSRRTRALYSQLQKDQVTRDGLLAQRSRLLIERGAMNSYNGTERLAKTELGMRFPETIVRVESLHQSIAAPGDLR